VRWVEWNRYFQGHPPSRVRGESVAAAATLLSVAITSSLARVVQPGLGAGRLTFLANPATALSTLLPASWSIKSYCLPTQAIIDEPPLTLVLNACPRLRSSHLPPSRALGFCHTAKSTIHLPLPISSLRRIQLSSEPRSFAVRCTASHWSLVHTHDSPDAVPRSLAINRPITRGFLANPRELLAITSLYPRQNTGRSVPPRAQGRATSCNFGVTARRCKLVTQHPAFLGAVAFALCCEHTRRRETTSAANVACLLVLALEAVSLRPNDLHLLLRPFAVRRLQSYEHQLIAAALHVVR
jgi:hypothetical protein